VLILIPCALLSSVKEVQTVLSPRPDAAQVAALVARATALIERVQAGMGSSGYTVGPLSEGEVCLRSFGRRMRSLIPETRLHKAPPKGWSTRREPELATAEQEFEFTAPQLAPKEVA